MEDENYENDCLESEYRQALSDCWNGVNEAIDLVSRAIHIHESMSSRYKDSSKLSRLTAILNDAQIIISELDS